MPLPTPSLAAESAARLRVCEYFFGVPRVLIIIDRRSSAAVKGSRKAKGAADPKKPDKPKPTKPKKAAKDKVPDVAVQDEEPPAKRRRISR